MCHLSRSPLFVLTSPGARSSAGKYLSVRHSRYPSTVGIIRAWSFFLVGGITQGGIFKKALYFSSSKASCGEASRRQVSHMDSYHATMRTLKLASSPQQMSHQIKPLGSATASVSPLPVPSMLTTSIMGQLSLRRPPLETKRHFTQMIFTASEARRLRRPRGDHEGSRTNGVDGSCGGIRNRCD